MYTDEELDTAASRGILTPEAVAAFRAHIAAQRRTAAVDEEHFRLVSGFNDIFVVIASVLLLVSVSWIGGAAAGWLGALANCIAAWLLAEFFVRKRRMALPAIVLLAAFVGGAFLMSLQLLGKNTAGFGLASAVAGLAAWLHWQRFKVPITVAAGVAVIVGGVIAAILSAIPESGRALMPLMFVAGLATFAYALRWDASDAARQTGRSDVAFWLHLLAAPLLVHPVFTLLGVTAGEPGAGQMVVVVAMYVGIALVSLAIDRRALMVSALGYVLYAFSALFKDAGVISLSFALTALLIGSALLMLSAFWQPSRAFALRLLPASWQARLPSRH